MKLAGHYKRQFGWRDWPTILETLPSLQGRTILDLGCGVGDIAAELVARGARVIGFDMNEDLIREARSRRLSNAAFRVGDLHTFPGPGVAVDGLWCSFTAAYFPDLPMALAGWVGDLKPGGWIALTEIDDLFGHEPLSVQTKALLRAYAEDALAAIRYDFYMGRKLMDHLERSGFTVLKVMTLGDKEFSFSGPACPEVLDGWRIRLNHMKLLRDFLGSKTERVHGEFLRCLMRQDHRSLSKVYCCIATKKDLLHE